VKAARRSFSEGGLFMSASFGPAGPKFRNLQISCSFPQISRVFARNLIAFAASSVTKTVNPA
jgi:hypothetical protein